MKSLTYNTDSVIRVVVVQSIFIFSFLTFCIFQT